MCKNAVNFGDGKNATFFIWRAEWHHFQQKTAQPNGCAVFFVE